MTEALDLTKAAMSADAAIGLRAALALRKLAERLEAVQVDNARNQGWSWQDIATALDVSKQAVHKKHADRSARARTKSDLDVRAIHPTGPGPW